MELHERDRIVYCDLDSVLIQKGPVEKKKLYVDGLNFSTQFGFTRKAWSFEVPQREIKHFVAACRLSGWEPTIFIDAGIESAEALEKWKSRRIREVIDAVRDVPHGLSSMMGDLFRSFAVNVMYSPWNVDCDDCLAFFAERDGASVLSNDIDFARYRGKTYDQFGTFTIEDDNLILIPKKIDERRLPSPRHLLTLEPKMVLHDPGFVYLVENGTYVRGSPCFATKFYGNLHGHVKELRHILYRRMGLTKVVESWPEFEDGGGIPEVVWNENTWLASESPNDDKRFVYERDDLLSSILIYGEVVKSMFAPILNVPDFTNDEKWNLEMSIMLVVSELIAAIRNVHCVKILTFLDTMTSIFTQLYDTSNDVKRWLQEYKPDFESPVPPVCRNWKADGNCNYGDKCFVKTGHFVCTCWRGDQCRNRH